MHREHCSALHRRPACHLQQPVGDGPDVLRNDAVARNRLSVARKSCG